MKVRTMPSYCHLLRSITKSPQPQLTHLPALNEDGTYRTSVWYNVSFLLIFYDEYCD